MKKEDIDSIIAEIDNENRLFKNKAALDIQLTPKNIVGRNKQARQLLKFLASYKQGYVSPFISVYGRSGSGKSTLVKFICESLGGISHCFVNLRNVKTIFGCANLILSELGGQNLKSAQGLNMAIEQIGESIVSKLTEQNKNTLVLILDEFDVIFSDVRNKPSDFVYKLMVLEEKLKQRNYQICIIGISNNVVSEYELDDRVRSRIGNAEVFFPSYGMGETLEILRERANEAFSEKIDDSVLQYCATLSSQEQGDARRAIDLLRVGAEIASTQWLSLKKSHIDAASEKLQNDRTKEILLNSSIQFKAVCGTLAALTFYDEDPWHNTSEIYDHYKLTVEKNLKVLSYRRVSEILVDIKNTGLASSQTRSNGRYGFGTQYCLLVPPQMVGPLISEEWWEKVESRKESLEQLDT